MSNKIQSCSQVRRNAGYHRQKEKRSRTASKWARTRSQNDFLEYDLQQLVLEPTAAEKKRLQAMILKKYRKLDMSLQVPMLRRILDRKEYGEYRLNLEQLAGMLKCFNKNDPRIRVLVEDAIEMLEKAIETNAAEAAEKAGNKSPGRPELERTEFDSVKLEGIIRSVERMVLRRGNQRNQRHLCFVS